MTNSHYSHFTNDWLFAIGYIGYWLFAEGAGAGERSCTVISALAQPSRTAGLLNHTRKKSA